MVPPITELTGHDGSGDVQAEPHFVCMQRGHKPLTVWPGEGDGWRWWEEWVCGDGAARSGFALPWCGVGRVSPGGAGRDEAFGQNTAVTPSPALSSCPGSQRESQGHSLLRAEDGLRSLRGNELCSGQPIRVKDQCSESGASSRTIIGDFVPKPDIWSITEIHGEQEFYIRQHSRATAGLPLGSSVSNLRDVKQF